MRRYTGESIIFVIVEGRLVGACPNGARVVVSYRDGNGNGNGREGDNYFEHRLCIIVLLY